jgi:hypothetical protein
VIVREAREVARQWVYEEGRTLRGFQGAYHAGSTNWLPEDSTFPATSDVDVMVVLGGPGRPGKRMKFIYHDLLLEVSYVPSHQLRSPELVLRDYHVAGAFRTPSVILDPSGRLTSLQEAVSRDFAKRRWVVERCEHARSTVLAHLRSLDRPVPLHDQVTAWLFGAGVTTHVLLVAGLRNPTVRARYLAVRELLAEYGRLELHETLLRLSGYDRMSPERVEQHLAALAPAFDAAAAVLRTPVPFASDITADARPIAIDASGDLVERGYHREALFWIAATYSRCQKVLHQDAPQETQARFDPGYRRLLADLGITSSADLQRRAEEVRRLLPRVWEEAEAIMAANPAIQD